MEPEWFHSTAPQRPPDGHEVLQMGLRLAAFGIHHFVIARGHQAETRAGTHPVTEVQDNIDVKERHLTHIVLLGDSIFDNRSYISVSARRPGARRSAAVRARSRA